MIAITTVFLLFVSFISSERYGESAELCLDQSIAGKSRSGHVIWCSDDSDCAAGFRCLPSGTTHFGREINYCCETRESICSQPPNPGYGDCMARPETRYYFDNLELKCKPFQFIDCIGRNQNQFESIDDCNKFCQSTACSADESLLLSASNTPELCAEGAKCPKGYKCVYDTLFRRHVCCGRINTGACAAGAISYASSPALLPLRCTPSSIADRCPPDYLCTTTARTHYCCTPEFGICPIGQLPFFHPVSGRSIKCDPFRPSAHCPNGFVCSSVVPGANWGFCCSRQINAVCHDGSLPYIEPTTKTPAKCTVGVTMCSVGYHCQSITGSVVGFCCSKQRKEIESEDGQNKISNPVYFSMPKSKSLYTSREEDYHRKEIRIVDIQKHVDSLYKNSKASKLPKNSLTEYHIKGAATQSTRHLLLGCPVGARPIYYQGTQLTMECSPAEGLTILCPEPASCVVAPLDYFGRSVCCVLPLTTTTSLPYTTHPRYTVAYNELSANVLDSPYIYTVTLKSPNLKTEFSSDPFCPTVISERSCVVGQRGQCPEQYFFCQYNVELRRFACCSMQVLAED